MSRQTNQKQQRQQAPPQRGGKQQPRYEAEELEIVTPVGVAVWPKLAKPDYTFKPEGEYSVDLRLDPDDPTHAALLDSVEEFQSQCYLNACKATGKDHPRGASPIRIEKDQDGNETGMMLLRFKMKAEVAPANWEPFTQRPKLFDASGKQVRVEVGGGSKIRVRGTARSWVSPLGAGVSLRLKGVQIIELVQYRGASAEDMGFEVVEGGFVSEDEFEPVSGGYRNDSGGDF